ncbi:negative regulator of the PHO system [Collariella sp. IMI 366227]|nr:negative regulator of the PHO system [Collariella sp. IMI 366227]
MATAFDGRSFVGDDHVPFMKRGAPVLHLIPQPFPDVWHTMEDDGEHLDMATVKDWARIVTAFTLEWMDVQNTKPGMGEWGQRGKEGQDHYENAYTM